MRRALFLLAWLTYWPGLASASDISVESLGPKKPSLVFVVGRMETGDYGQFLTKIGSLSGAIVVFQSEGGNLVTGIQIGETVRLKNFATLVPAGSYCASACALAWLGGARRFMAPTAKIGFHAAYDAATRQETGVGNALVGAYLNKIGLAYSAVIYITKASPTSMTWLNREQARERGIDVTILELPDNAQSEQVPARPQLSPKVVADPVDYLRRHPECHWDPLERLMCPNRVVPDRSSAVPKLEKYVPTATNDPADYLRRHPECHWEPLDGVMCPSR